MCGLVGIFDTKAQRNIERSLLSRMNETQFHRGPDEGGLHLEPGLGFGHRRLSIIDLSTGQQPLFNEDGSVVVTFNGEIYNFEELTKTLQAAGHTFRSHSDTEVIVHAWEEWGEACVQKFRGMFAFAIWDRNQRTLFIARDRLGIKPLFYALLPDGMLVFASELKALLVHKSLDRSLNNHAIEDYFAYGYIPDPKTVFKNAHKLPPGYTLTMRQNDSAPRLKQYWDLHFTPHAMMTEAEAGEELIQRVREAVGSHMVSEVPLGAFLSGGVDSSAVVAMMAGLSAQPINTCSISFSDPKFNEAEFATSVANRYKTHHYAEQLDADDLGMLDKLPGMYDEPFADSSAMPTYRVCQLARKRVTVALSGDGGDESLAGYRRHKWHMYEERMRSMIPLSIRSPLFGLLGHVYPKADWAPKVFRAKSTFESLARDSVAAYFHSVSVLGDTLRQRLFSKDFSKQLQGYQAIEVFREHDQHAPRHDALARIQYIDMKTYLAGDILTKVDRASMAHALEVRVPLLDHQLVEWIAGMPSSLKLKHGEGKYIFKKSLEAYLPHDILYRPKMGFSVPLASWFRGPLRERLSSSILGKNLSDSGIFDSQFLKEMVDQHQSGRRDYSAPLWSLLMFEGFLSGLIEK